MLEKNVPIIVGRDRAHVRELLQNAPFAEVISASAFFDKVRSLAFIYDYQLKRDDFAPVLFAKEALSIKKSFPFHYAKSCARIYSSLYHGTMSPADVFAELAPKKGAYVPALEIACMIDRRMEENSLVNGVSALFLAWQIMKRHNIVPHALRNRAVSLYYLVDLTKLEIEVIKALSRLGIHFDIHFPMDFEKRSFNVAVDYAARQFENNEDLFAIDLYFDALGEEGPLKTLVEKVLKEPEEIILSAHHATLHAASSVDEEAKKIAQKIALIKSQSPSERVALVVRNLDSRSTIYKRTLMAQGLAVKDRKGIPLTETPAGILLQSLFSARTSNLSRADLLALLSSPFSSFFLLEDEKRAMLNQILSDLGIDDQNMTAFSDRSRYAAAIQQGQRIWHSDEEQLLRLNLLAESVAKIEEKLSLLKASATLSEYLSLTSELFSSAFRNEDASAEALKNALAELRKSADHIKDPHLFSFNDFHNFLNQELSALTLAPEDNKEINAVEFLMLPELLGRAFEHVFIADISFGKMPQNQSADALLSDDHRLQINKALGKDVLRVYFDDPFEPLPVPPRQALEPFWFISAVAAAKKSVHFSYAKFDQSGSEQAPSEFFAWLERYVKILPHEENEAHFLSPFELRFYEAQEAAQRGEDTHPYAQALTQRLKMFKNGLSDNFAGQADEAVFKQFFHEKTLTPTLLESFAACKFYGLLHRILGLKSQDLVLDELDARFLGQIAHRSLEKFFALGHFKKNDWKKSFTVLFEEICQQFLEKNYVANNHVFYCQMEWLSSLLMRLIDYFNKHHEGRALAFEIPFGGKKAKEAIPIRTLDREFLLGGIIDRLDQHSDELLVIDYKLSSLDNLRANASEAALMKSNFQIPIYLRLAHSMIPKDKEQHISFAYASLRDGKIEKVFSDTKNEALFKRIIDDDADKSLAKEIEALIRPIEQGLFPAQISEKCDFCDFSSICRKSEAQ